MGKMKTFPLMIVLLLMKVANGKNDRNGKSLVNTFPFNQNEEGQEQHGHHQEDHGGDHHEDHGQRQGGVQDIVRDSRQGEENELGVSFDNVAGVQPDGDGRRCVDKLQMVEEIEYEEVITCDHSYDKRCHTTYVTNYDSQQEGECEENFRKTCFIEYEQVAFNETVSVCTEPLVKDCSVTGPDICRTEYESECWTKQGCIILAPTGAQGVTMCVRLSSLNLHLSCFCLRSL